MLLLPTSLTTFQPTCPEGLSRLPHNPEGFTKRKNFPASLATATQTAHTRFQSNRLKKSRCVSSASAFFFFTAAPHNAKRKYPQPLTRTRTSTKTTAEEQGRSSAEPKILPFSGAVFLSVCLPESPAKFTKCWGLCLAPPCTGSRAI